ncbi:heme exporter protein CcmB [Reichenbachiella agariperforans]|uniref:Heme exporter protein B n=1 Tax=Reichenbachiella agariperforans TaxID=156994 RepID=A0A1M6NWA6_REIAG|nr:heme exporter protein CcmB [Reichenbachiella agariperforans]MBU2916062.1 heme exporter protein CcmB [Reichenbachiella agariperforans]SHJ99942.1 heme exporter protein B [Reichenbachiella agariperforans]
MLKEIKALLWKDIVLEWRHKYALNGILLYTFSTIFICYLSFEVLHARVDQFSWNALYWIIILFTSISTVAKSFIQEKEGRQLYYFNLVRPQSIILSKIIYNSGLLVLLAVLAFGVFSLVLGNRVQDPGFFVLIILAGTVGFATTLSLMSGIASKADNNGMLMAILSFPVIIPVLLMIIKLSRNAIDGIARSESLDELLTLLAIDMIVGTLAYLLFPYLWRS